MSAVVPGDPAKSELLARVRSAEPTEVMPPAKSGKKLTAREIDILDRWVKQGAGYSAHWAYVPPVRPPVPATKHPTRSPIDSFLFYRLEREGLSPQPEADRYALLRRAALDLTGVPPTWAEAEAFAKDTAEGAYERQVDRLLASPRFGEHWARRGSTLPATPTAPATPTTHRGRSGSTATTSSGRSTTTCRSTGSPSSSWPATCCRTRPTTS